MLSKKRVLISGSSKNRRGFAPVEKVGCESLNEYLCDNSEKCAYDKRDGECIDVEEIVSRGEEVLDIPADDMKKQENLQKIMKTSYEYNLFKSLKLWRERCTDIVTSKRVAKDCELGTWIENLFVYESGKEKQSVSSTIIIKGLLSPTKREIEKREDSNIIIKTSFASRKKLDNSLSVEQAIYQYIIPNLVLNMHTPGVVYALGTLDCGAVSRLPPTQLVKYEDEVKMIAEPVNKEGKRIRSSYDTSKPSLLVMEKSKGVTLSNWFEKERKQEDILSVIFICIYTLNCFANIGLRHNDLHFGNIFVEDMRTYVDLYFKVEDGKIIKVKTRYIPKIYDFDRGAILSPLVPRNILLDSAFCTDYGTCNANNPKYDLYTFITLLYQNIAHGIEEKQKKRQPAKQLEDIEAKFIEKCVNKAWFAKEIDREWNHLLPPNVYPTDAQLVSHAKALEILYTTSWNRNIFTILRPPVPIPKTLYYSLPAKKTVKYQMVLQTNMGDTPFVLLESFIDSLPEYNEGKDAEQDYLYKYMDALYPILYIWGREITNVTNQKFYTFAKQVFFAVKAKNPLIEKRLLIFEFACLTLCCYQYYSLTVDDRRKIFGDVLMKVIGCVWNTVGNILPVKIPMLYLE